MRKWTLLLLLPVHCLAADVSIQLDNVKVSELAALVFGDILKSNFIVSPALLAKPESVRVHVDLKEGAGLKNQLMGVMASTGVDVEQRDDIYYLKPASEPKKPDEEVFVYRPKYRSVAYLVDLVSALFPADSFTLRRAVSGALGGSAGGQMAGQGTASPPTGKNAPTGAASQPTDNGSNAFSQLDKAPPDTLVFRGSAKDQGKLAKLLQQLDVATPELLVKAVVYEVSTDSDEHSAMSMAVSILGSKLQVNAGSATPGSFSAVFKSNSFQAIADALSSDVHFKVVSSPQIRVRSGQQASLTVGSDVPVLGAAQLDKNGNPVQSVDYKSSGVIFNIAPEVRAEDSELTLTQQISNFITTTTGVNSSPTLIKRELRTVVGVKGDDVIVLGGMDQDKRTESKAGLSFLPSFFRSDSDVRNRSEVLLILQAQRI